jgi:uncharacterized RDD family membrane protein YckC
MNKTEKLKIYDFDAQRFHASFTLRCCAFLFDYVLLIAAPVICFMIASSSGVSGVKLFKQEAITIGWLIALIILLINFVVLPMIIGQTLGKAAMGLRVVQKNGTNLTVTSALIRHLIGYPLTLLTAGIGYLLVIFDSKNRALHDYLAGTVVVQARRTRIK